MTAPEATPGGAGETRYLPTRVVIKDGRPVRSYELAVDNSVADPSTTRPQPSDPPRIFIAGPQRVPLPGPDTFDELELAFTRAERRLERTGYHGVYIRLVPALVELGPDRHSMSIFPRGAGSVPTEYWQHAVLVRMKHCAGVALLDVHTDSEAIEWERARALEMGKPVRPLEEWLTR